MNDFVPFSSRTGRGILWILATLTLGLSSGCEKAKPITLTMPALPPRTVSAATVVAQDVPVYLDAEGQTTALQSVNIVAQVDGQIVDMPFTQGSMVKKGDKLAQIFPDLFDAAVKKAQGQLDTDKAHLALAQSTFERNKSMLPEKLISQQQYDAYAAEVAALQGQVKVDESLLDTAKVNLNYATITSPVDGMVGTYRMSVGNVIKANDLPITTIQTLNPIYADFVISESDFPALRRYFDANGGKLKVHVTSLSDAKAQADGELTILGNAIGTTTGTISLRATLPNEKLLFWPNQPIHVRILLDTLHDAIVVPEPAVLLSQQGEFVFVVAPAAKAGDMPTAEMRVVKAGQLQEDGTKVITSGLKAGETVVVQGQVFLAPTMPLIISELNGKPTTAAVPAAGSASGSAAGSGKP